MINIKELNWSNHARVEREDRMMAILMTVGFGEICYEKKCVDDETRIQYFTDTGCILIVSGDIIITGYIASIDQALGFFSGKVPISIRKAVAHSNKMIKNYVARF